MALEIQAGCAGMKGDWKKAAEFFQEIHRLTNHPLKGIGPLGHAYAKLGQKEKALEIIGKLEQRQSQEPDMVLDGDLLMVWWALDDQYKIYKEKVVHHLSNCFNKGLDTMHYYVEYPMMSGMKKYPEIVELLEKNVSLKRAGK